MQAHPQQQQHQHHIPSRVWTMIAHYSRSHLTVLLLLLQFFPTREFAGFLEWIEHDFGLLTAHTRQNCQERFEHMCRRADQIAVFSSSSSDSKSKWLQVNRENATSRLITILSGGDLLRTMTVKNSAQRDARWTQLVIFNGFTMSRSQPARRARTLHLRENIFWRSSTGKTTEVSASNIRNESC